MSLKSLAADLLNVCLDKSLELRCSDWEADQLTLEQVVIFVFQHSKSAISESKVDFLTCIWSTSMVWISIKLLVEFISTKDEQQHYKIFFPFI